MLVYLNGNNNLDQFGAFNIIQMQKAGSTDHLNVVVQWASQAAEDTKRLLVVKDTAATTVTSPTVQDLPVVDMGKKETLLDFITWGVQTYPADHYFVVVWDHGAGWHLLSPKPMAQNYDISFDERTGNHITTEELGGVLAQAAQVIGHKVDIYGSDACMMSMVEVAAEMAGSVDTFIGSEETEPGAGWPYDLFLGSWNANPTADNAQIGKFLVDSYKAYYTQQGTSNATMATIDMNQLPQLIAGISALKDKLAAKTNMSVISQAAASSSRFTYSDYVDLSDLVDNVRTALDKTDEAQVALDSMSQLIKTAVTSTSTTGMKANGISIWWPTDSSGFNSYSTRYKGLKFDQAAHWSDFLAKTY